MRRVRGTATFWLLVVAASASAQVTADPADLGGEASGAALEAAPDRSRFAMGAASAVVLAAGTALAIHNARSLAGAGPVRPGALVAGGAMALLGISVGVVGLAGPVAGDRPGWLTGLSVANLAVGAVHAGLAAAGLLRRTRERRPVAIAPLVAPRAAGLAVSFTR